MTRARMDDLATSSLGEILVRMKVVTVGQLEEALDMQKRMSPEEMLGQLLVAQGIIDNDQLQVALDAQKGLRSKSKHSRALAMSRLAEISGQRVADLVAKIDTSSRECLRAYGGAERLPAVMTKAIVHGQGNGQRK